MPEPTYRIAQALHARRAAVGLNKYGEHLTADSPGCMIVHAIEEAADLTEYLLAEAQRRADAIRKLMAMVSDMEAQGYWPMMHRANAVIDLLGGEAALAKYDEILGGAENATVASDPRDEPAISTLHKFATAELPQIETITTSGDLPTDPRDEALRVAESALLHIQRRAEPLGIDIGDSVTHLIATNALEAIRGAR